MNHTLRFLSSMSLVMTLTGPGLALANQVYGVVQIVKGGVQVQSLRDGKTVNAKVGMKVYPKDTVITGKDARIKIVMVDKNVINVSPDSKLQIANYEFDPDKDRKEVSLNVIYGKVRAKVEQRYDGAQNKFQVKTPTAVAGVRGTDFLAGYAPSTQMSQVVTFEGEVSFGLPGPNGSIADAVAVKPGQFSEMAGNTPPPPPQMMPQGQLASLDQESKADSFKGDSRQPSNEQPQGQERKEPNKDSEKNDPNKSDSNKNEPGKSSDEPKNGSNQRGPEGGDQKQRPEARGTSGERPQNNGEGGSANADSRSGSGGGTPGPRGAPLPATGSNPSGPDQAKGPAPQPGVIPGPNMPGTPDASHAPRGPSSMDGMPAGGAMPGGLPPQPGSMIRPEDLASSPSGVMPDFNSMMPPPPPQTYMPPQPIICEFCTRLIENGNALIRLQITNQ